MTADGKNFSDITSFRKKCYRIYIKRMHKVKYVLCASQ